MKWNFVDSEGEIIRTVEIEVPLRMKTDDARFYLEEMESGKFRFLWSAGLLEEFKNVDHIQIVR